MNEDLQELYIQYINLLERVCTNQARELFYRGIKANPAEVKKGEEFRKLIAEEKAKL